MSIIARAPKAAPLQLTLVGVALAQDAANPGTPCILTIPGSASLDLKVLGVTATGWVQPNQPGHFQIILYGLPFIPHTPPPPLLSTQWVDLAVTTQEIVGGSGDPIRAQWMFKAQNLTYFLNRDDTGKSGKLQGEFISNSASNPLPAAPLVNTESIALLTGVDPVMMFALGFICYPDSGVYPPTPIVQIENFILTGDD